MVINQFSVTLVNCRRPVSMGQGGYLLGVTERVLCPNELSVVNQFLMQIRVPCVREVKVGSHLFLDDNTVFYLAGYKRMKVRNSYTVKYLHRVGQISAFLSVNDGLDHIFVLLVKLVQTATCRIHY